MFNIKLWLARPANLIQTIKAYTKYLSDITQQEFGHVPATGTRTQLDNIIKLSIVIIVSTWNKLLWNKIKDLINRNTKPSIFSTYLY